MHSKSLVQRARFPARISGMENMEIFSSLNTIAFFNNKLYKNNEAEIGEKIRTEQEHFEARKIQIRERK